MHAPDTPSPLVVVGAGFTGRRLAQLCARKGVPVLATVSSNASFATLTALAESGGFTAQQWPLDDTTAPPVTARATVVYLVPPPREGDDDPRIGRALAALDPGLSRFVYISTTGVYGNRDGALVTEADAPTPQSARAKRRVAAEQRVRRWCDAHGVAWVVLRVPGIYGPGRLQLATVRSGRPMLDPAEAGPGNRIHVDDLVRVIEAATVRLDVTGVVNVGDGDPITNTEFVSEVARQLELPAPPQISRARLREQVTERAWSFLRESRRVDVTRMWHELGVSPRYLSAADGIAASIAEMRDSGAL